MGETQCAVCTSRNSIYTCPRCSVRTCSLPCSVKHKFATGCNGERNKATYVPMNQYGWGTMMGDYVFLEDVGRKVQEWGREIVKEGFEIRGASIRNGNSRGRGANFRGRGQRGGGRSKRELLQMQLEIRDIGMDLLPLGMERRKLNQSVWDFKKQTAFLTIEFKFHRPQDPWAPSSQAPAPPVTRLTHKNNINSSLLCLIQTQVSGRSKSKKEACPAWVTALVYPDPDDVDSFHPPKCVMKAPSDPLARPSSRTRVGYYNFDPSQKLLTLLRYTQFVEFPTIEVWHEFHGTIVDPSGTITQYSEEEPRLKRRRIDVKAAKKTMNGLLGGYGSDDDGLEPEPQNVLATLGDYADSEAEDGQTGVIEDQAKQDDDTDAEGDTDAEVELDPGALLELLKSAKRQQEWDSDDAEEDAVDWGDSDEEMPA